MTTNTELRASLISLARDLILIPSTESRPVELRRCLEFVSNHLDGLSGVKIDEYECNDHKSIVARPTQYEIPEILLCGHLDVIDHPQPDCYHSKVDAGRIYGPGAGDMKGADAILIELFRTLHRDYSGISLGLALTTDEEQGGGDGLRYLCDEAGLRCRFAVIPDGGSLNDVTVEEKGVLHARVRRSGHEAHGARPWLGVNAVELLLVRLIALRQHFGQYWPDKDQLDQQDHWFPTCSITILTTPNETANRIPAEAEAVLDIRFPPPHTVESIGSEVSELLGPDVEVETIMTAAPTRLDPDPEFCEATTEITGKPIRRIKASGTSDSRFLRRNGTPVNLAASGR